MIICLFPYPSCRQQTLELGHISNVLTFLVGTTGCLKTVIRYNMLQHLMTVLMQMIRKVVFRSL